MARILILSGPTREYLDPVRFISNGSSGRMGAALAAAVLAAGHDVVVVTGPVEVQYPGNPSQLVRVVTTEEMLAAAIREFPSCVGAIAAAAPCDFRPKRFSTTKIRKAESPGTLELEETPDIIATLGKAKRANQWTVGFALETENGRDRAIEKMHRKRCDWIVLNGPQAIDADRAEVEMIASDETSQKISGDKAAIARFIVDRVLADD